MSAALTAYVMTADLERLRQFYEEGLGVTPGDQSGNWVPFEMPLGTFALHGASADADFGLVALSFTVDDIDASIARFESAGAKILRGVADEAFGKRAVLEDPDGRTIEIVQHEV